MTSDLSLDHGRPLCPQHLHGLEDIDHAFVAHSLQDDAEGDEDSGPPHAGTANKRQTAVKGPTRDSLEARSSEERGTEAVLDPSRPPATVPCIHGGDVLSRGPSLTLYLHVNINNVHISVCLFVQRCCTNINSLVPAHPEDDHWNQEPS